MFRHWLASQEGFSNTLQQVIRTVLKLVKNYYQTKSRIQICEKNSKSNCPNLAIFFQKKENIMTKYST
jgi:hypothetical protein